MVFDTLLLSKILAKETFDWKLVPSVLDEVGNHIHLPGL